MPRAVLALSVVPCTLVGVPNVACLTRSEDEVRRCLHLGAPNDDWLAFRAKETEGPRQYVCPPRSAIVTGEMLVEN